MGETKKRILFVDDEPNVLQGLRRMMRPFRHQWNMDFAESGAEALTRLSEEPFDVIVSDMRMPGMDGAELLNQVKNKHPQIIRFILSGQSDQEMVMKSIGPTHQFLSKPCDADTLKNTISRAFSLREILADTNLKGLTSNLKSLPSLPGLYFEIIEELQSDDYSLGNVGKIIAKDVGMTAKILQIVNSSFFGLGVRVLDPVHAVRLLGPDIVRALVISAQVFSKFSKSGQSGLCLEKLLKHSITVASLARNITQNEGMDKKFVDDALIAGMLHDTGKLVLAENLPHEYRQIETLMSTKGISALDAEIEIFGATHAEVGAYLVGIWGLPDYMVEALAFHHYPEKSPHHQFNCLTAVYVANELANALANQDERSEPISWVSKDYLKNLNLEDKLQEWEKVARDTYLEMEKRDEENSTC